ncbi:MAG: DNA-processing protein DprA [Hyphomicrobium sp.]
MAPRAPPETLFQAAPLPTATLGDDERLACLRLIRSENVGPTTFRHAINLYGGAAEALQALPDLSLRGGRRAAIRVASISEARAELEAAAKAGATPVFTIEPGYPRLLAAIDTPPPMVYVKGRTDLFDLPAVAIVGSRQCSAAGAKLAAQFAARLADDGFAIVSGFARGIDRVAHEASLGRGTIAVLAGGIDSIYPPEHAALYEKIASCGALVSERPPGHIAREKDFPRRNRIIAGLSLGVIVIEAAARSGTLITARYANEQGREVFAVPGHPLDPRAESVNNLIKSGATMVTSPEDVREALAPIIGVRGPCAMREVDQIAPKPQTSHLPDVGAKECAAVLAALGPAPTDLDGLARATQLTARDIQIALLELELAGRVTRPGPGLIARRMED